MKTIHVAFQEVADGLVGYQKSLQSLAARNRAITAFQTTVRLSFLKFEEGQESYTTVLTAENELYSAQLQAIDERSSMIDVMGRTFGGIMATMTEQDLTDYVDGTVLNGEFSTLQAMPQIAEALAQARQARETEIRQTTPP